SGIVHEHVRMRRRGSRLADGRVDVESRMPIADSELNVRSVRIDHLDAGGAQGTVDNSGTMRVGEGLGKLADKVDTLRQTQTLAPLGDEGVKSLASRIEPIDESGSGVGFGVLARSIDAWMVKAADQLVLAPCSTRDGGSRLLIRRRVHPPNPHAGLGLER